VRQTLWLSSDETRYQAPCEACRADLARSRDAWTRRDWSVGLRSTIVEGSLRAEADVGFTTCRRGHRLVVRRAVSRPLVAVR